MEMQWKDNKEKEVSTETMLKWGPGRSNTFGRDVALDQQRKRQQKRQPNNACLHVLESAGK